MQNFSFIFYLGAPVYGFIRGTVPCNDKLAELMDDVRPLLRDAVESVNKVKWKSDQQK